MSQSTHSPVAAFFGLLALWVGVELLYASRWLSFATSDRSPPHNSQANNTLRDLLSRPTGQPVAKVWFAPYNTFPETGAIESRIRTGVYDTFKAFPSNGLKTNYGAFKLSPADSLFAQISSDGIEAEARLAKQLGYTQFALDLGAVVEPTAALALCQRTKGCQKSSDGYALFPIGPEASRNIEALASVRRAIALLPEQSAAFRWNGLVFEPEHWWLPSTESLTGSASSFRLRARPTWTMSLYRFNPTGLAPTARQVLAPKDLLVKAMVGPGLAGVDLCISPKVSTPSNAACHKVQLRKGAAPVDITGWLPAGSVTEIKVEHLYDLRGFPATMDELPISDSGEGAQQASPFSLDIAPLRPR